VSTGLLELFFPCRLLPIEFREFNILTFGDFVFENAPFTHQGAARSVAGVDTGQFFLESSNHSLGFVDGILGAAQGVGFRGGVAEGPAREYLLRQEALNAYKNGVLNKDGIVDAFCDELEFGESVVAGREEFLSRCRVIQDETAV